MRRGATAESAPCEPGLSALQGGFSRRELILLDEWFEPLASSGQRPPEGNWRVWMMMAGRGFGKTRAGAEWVHRCAVREGGMRIALVGATLQEARSVMVEGRSGLLAVAASAGVELKFEPSQGRLRWPNGSSAQLFSGDSPEGLRGPEHHLGWCDELAKWRHGLTVPN